MSCVRLGLGLSFGLGLARCLVTGTNSRFVVILPNTYLLHSQIAFLVRVRIPSKGPFKCYVTLFVWILDPHPPPRNANNVEPYTFVTLFPGKVDTPHHHLRYVTLEWPLTRVVNLLGNKSNSQGSGKYRELPGITGNYREILGNRYCYKQLTLQTAVDNLQKHC